MICRLGKCIVDRHKIGVSRIKLPYLHFGIRDGRRDIFNEVCSLERAQKEERLVIVSWLRYDGAPLAQIDLLDLGAEFSEVLISDLASGREKTCKIDVFF